MATNSQTPFGIQLRQFREDAAISQEVLAERSGLSLRGISDLERGARLTPRLETVRLLADGLNLNETQRAMLIAARGDSMVRPLDSEALDVPPLPGFPTSFFGREAEIERLLAMLARDDVRLVTLTGPGGVAKRG